MSIITGYYELKHGYKLVVSGLDLAVTIFLVLTYFLHRYLGYMVAAWYYMVVMALYVTFFSLVAKGVDIEFFLLVLMVFGFVFFDSSAGIISSGILNFSLFVFVKFLGQSISFSKTYLPVTTVNPNHVLLFLVMSLLVWVIKKEVIDYEGVISKQRDAFERKNKELSLQKQMVEHLYNNLVDSIVYAQRIQFSFFPSREYLKEKLGRYGLIFLPREGVSGDFYMFQEDEDVDFVVVGDSTGHGISGAMLSIMFMVSLKQIFEQSNGADRSLVEILDIAREQVKDNLRRFSLERDEGADIGIVKLSKDRRRLSFSGANMDLLVVRSGVLYTLKGVRTPLGYYYKELDFREEDFVLEEGDRIILYSDGYVDQINPLGRRLSTSRFKKKILETCGLSPSEQARALLDFFFKWKGDNQQTDDVTVFILEV